MSRRRVHFSITQLLLLTALCGLFAGWFATARQSVSFQQFEGLAFSPDNRLLAVNAQGTAIRGWDLSAESPRSRLLSVALKASEQLRGPSPVFVDDRTAMFVVGDWTTTSGEIRLWDVFDDKQVRSIRLPGVPESMIFGSESGLVGCLTYNGLGHTLTVWDLSTSQQTAELDLPPPCLTPCFSADGKHLIVHATPSGEHEMAMETWALKTGEVIARWAPSAAGSQCVFSSDGRRVAIWNYEYMARVLDLQVWDIDARELVWDRSAIRIQPTASIGLSPHGDRLSISDLGGRVEIWDVDSGEQVTEWNAGLGRFGLTESLEFSPDGDAIAGCTWEQVVLWKGLPAASRTTLAGGVQWASTAIFAVGCLLWPLAWGLAARRQRRLAPIEVSSEPEPLKLPAAIQAGLHPWRALGKVLIWLSLVMLPMAWLLTGSLQQFSGWSNAMSFVTLACSLPVAGMALLLLYVKLRQGCMRSVAAANAKSLRRATDIVGLTPRSIEFGHVQAHFFGPSQIELAIQGEYESVRQQFRQLVGEEVAPDRPLLVLVFQATEHLDAYLQGKLNFEGIYWMTPNRQILLCEQRCLDQLHEPLSIFRSLVTTYLLEQTKGQLPASWIQLALTRRAAASDPAAVARRIHRVLRTWMLSSQQSRRVPFLTMPDRQLIETLLQTQRREDFQRAAYAADQVVSLGCYLLGEQAGSRYGQFLAFLKDVQGQDRGEAEFARHFGYGFDRLVADWHDWALAQPIEPYEALPPIVLRHFHSMIAPLILDPAAPLAERVEAVRNVGATGYTYVCGVLIKLLQSEPPVALREEAEWALQAASGQMQQDLAGWQRWWDEVAAQGVFAGTPFATLPPESDPDDVVCAELVAPPVTPAESEVSVPPPKRLTTIRVLMALGGVCAIVWSFVATEAFPVMIDGMLSGVVQVYGVGSGMFALACVAGGETRQLRRAASLLSWCLITCNAFAGIAGIVCSMLLRHRSVQRYLSQPSRN